MNIQNIGDILSYYSRQCPDELGLELSLWPWRRISERRSAVSYTASPARYNFDTMFGETEILDHFKLKWHVSPDLMLLQEWTCWCIIISSFKIGRKTTDTSAIEPKHGQTFSSINFWKEFLVQSVEAGTHRMVASFLPLRHLPSTTAELFNNIPQSCSSISSCSLISTSYSLLRQFLPSADIHSSISYLSSRNSNSYTSTYCMYGRIHFLLRVSFPSVRLRYVYLYYDHLI